MKDLSDVDFGRLRPKQSIKKQSAMLCFQRYFKMWFKYVFTLITLDGCEQAEFLQSINNVK